MGLPPSSALANRCAPGMSAEDFNRQCFCLSVEPQVLRAQLESVLAAHGMRASLADSHPHLYSAFPVYVSPRQLEQTADVVRAVEQVVALPAYQDAVLSWAPEIARFDPGSPGGLLGLDFHLSAAGPRLIEINTNPGGALLNALLGQAQHACMPELMAPASAAGPLAISVLESMRSEWRMQRGHTELGFVAIVDSAPEQQFLYPEFVLYQELLCKHGYRAQICAPEALVLEQGRLLLDGSPVDFIYNRLTDFALEQAAQQHLREAYLAGGVALSPHPRAHALYADKRNLSVLGDREFLESQALSPELRAVLSSAVPHTQLLTPDNREALWSQRNRLFFKPAGGFGSKASYRGDKLTRRVWEEIQHGTYVAQELVLPSERHIAADRAPLKVDIRCYAYRGQVLQYAARMYQGQTTNFRTPDGGFAPVLTRVANPECEHAS